VWARAAGYNNDAAIAGSLAASVVKAAYYRAFALVYGACGAFAGAVRVERAGERAAWIDMGRERDCRSLAWCARATKTHLYNLPFSFLRNQPPQDVAMVNSSWTAGHIRALWWRRAPPERVYPPCDTAELRRLPLDRRLKHLYLVSVAQFRPEKNHKLQLDAYALARRAAGADEAGRAVRVSRIKFIGGVRGPDDAALLAELQDYAEQLGLGAAVEWRVNAPHAELVSLLGGAVGGLHSMVEEHFGIGVVEYMAAGAVPIAHDSGGPRADIVVPLPRPAAGGRNDDADGGAAYEDAHGGGGGGADDDGDGLAAKQQQQQLEQQRPNGYLARTVDEYADAITAVLSMGQARRLQIAAAAQARAARFSTEAFEEGWLRALAPVLPATTEQERAGAADAGRGGSSGARHAAAAAAAASGEDEGVDAGSSGKKAAGVLLDGTAAAAQAPSPSRSPATRRSARRA
jgi:alpha-1,2-mannosyltransferase